MTAPVLEVEGLVTEFATRGGAARAVDGVSLSLGAGEILGLVGESGSGKSVTGFSLMGLLDPPGRIVAGSVRLEGRELVGLPDRRMRALRGVRIAMVFQDPMTTLNPVLTVGAQMTLAMRAHGRVDAAQARARAVAALRRVGLPAPEARVGAYPHEMSGGMRQRVAIAMALLHDPAVLIADEPTTALDVSIQAQILAEARALARDQGVAIIWISHDLATVSALADRIAVMYAGRIVEEGPTAQVLRRPAHPYARGLIDSLPAAAPAPGARLAQIPGAPPSLFDRPDGCAFRPRCLRAADQCAIAPPREARGARAWRCWRPLDLAETGT